MLDRINVTDVTTPAGVKPGVRNWRIWRSVALAVAPIYIAPLANCGTLVCNTTGTNEAPAPQVLRLGADDRLVGSHSLDAGHECRGIAAEPDGHFAVLLWDNAGDRIYVKRFDAAARRAGRPSSPTPTTTRPTSASARAAWNSAAAATAPTTTCTRTSGHEGDTLKWVDAASGAETTRGAGAARTA